MSKERPIRTKPSPYPGEGSPFIIFEPDYDAPARIAGREIPLTIQRAIAESVDKRVLPAMKDYKISLVSSEDREELKYYVLSQIKELKDYLGGLETPVRTLEARYNYLKRTINNLRRTDNAVDFAYKFASDYAMDELKDSREQDEAKKRLADVAGYHASWEVLRVEKNPLATGRNPFEPVLGMAAFGIHSFRFVRSHGKEKIHTSITPVSIDNKPLKIAA